MAVSGKAGRPFSWIFATFENNEAQLMSTQDIKSEIRKSLDRVPDQVLRDILEYLRQAENQPLERIQLARHLREIIAEDTELLARLAK
ncbi:MAG: hypothetical protein ACK5ZH_06960 [Alphaproteobacteria bacterium]|jgi:hypothetical protein